MANAHHDSWRKAIAKNRPKFPRPHAHFVDELESYPSPTTVATNAQAKATVAPGDLSCPTTWPRNTHLISAFQTATSPLEASGVGAFRALDYRVSGNHARAGTKVTPYRLGAYAQELVFQCQRTYELGVPCIVDGTGAPQEPNFMPDVRLAVEVEFAKNELRPGPVQGVSEEACWAEVLLCVSCRKRKNACVFTIRLRNGRLVTGTLYVRIGAERRTFAELRKMYHVIEKGTIAITDDRLFAYIAVKAPPVKVTRSIPAASATSEQTIAVGDEFGEEEGQMPNEGNERDASEEGVGREDSEAMLAQIQQLRFTKKAIKTGNAPPSSGIRLIERDTARLPKRTLGDDERRGREAPRHVNASPGRQKTVKRARGEEYEQPEQQGADAHEMLCDGLAQQEQRGQGTSRQGEASNGEDKDDEEEDDHDQNEREIPTPSPGRNFHADAVGEALRTLKETLVLEHEHSRIVELADAAGLQQESFDFEVLRRRINTMRKRDNEVTALKEAARGSEARYSMLMERFEDEREGRAQDKTDHKTQLTQREVELDAVKSEHAAEITALRNELAVALNDAATLRADLDRISSGCATHVGSDELQRRITEICALEGQLAVERRVAKEARAAQERADAAKIAAEEAKGDLLLRIRQLDGVMDPLEAARFPGESVTEMLLRTAMLRECREASASTVDEQVGVGEARLQISLITNVNDPVGKRVLLLRGPTMPANGPTVQALLSQPVISSDKKMADLFTETPSRTA